MSKPSFGFDNLADIRPTPAAPIAAREAAVDRAGEALGFASRQAIVRRRRRTPSEEPTDQINIRASIADINRFVAWCEKERLSYREGFGRLVSAID